MADFMPPPSILYFTSYVLTAQHTEGGHHISCAVGVQPSLHCIRVAQACLAGTRSLTTVPSLSDTLPQLPRRHADRALLLPLHSRLPCEQSPPPPLAVLLLLPLLPVLLRCCRWAVLCRAVGTSHWHAALQLGPDGLPGNAHGALEHRPVAWKPDKRAGLTNRRPRNS